MTELGLASTAYCFVLLMVGLLLVVLFFCEFGRNRGESPTNSSLKGSVLTVMVPVEGYKSKLLSRSEVPWPLREIFRKDKLKMDTKMVTGNSETKKGCRNCSLEIIAGNPSDSEISQPDKIYAGS